MRVGVVELHVDVRERPASHLRDAIVADPRGRERNGRDALAEARDRGCDVVLFPGWTLIAGRTPPAWLRAASAGATVVCECIPPDGGTPETLGKYGDAPSFEGQFHVVRNGEPLLNPVQQVLAQASHLAAHGESLVAELSTARRWRQGRLPAFLMACGEVNIVAGGGRSPPRWERADLPDPTSGGPRLIMNPAHTPSPLAAMRDKRRFLSRQGGWLFTTANLYAARDGSRYRAAAAWHDGERVELKTPDVPARERGFAVHIVEVG